MFLYIYYGEAKSELFKIIEMFSMDKEVTSCRKKKTDLTPFGLIATIF